MNTTKEYSTKVIAKYGINIKESTAQKQNRERKKSLLRRKNIAQKRKESTDIKNEKLMMKVAF